MRTTSPLYCVQTAPPLFPWSTPAHRQRARDKSSSQGIRSARRIAIPRSRKERRHCAETPHYAGVGFLRNLPEQPSLDVKAGRRSQRHQLFTLIDTNLSTTKKLIAKLIKAPNQLRILWSSRQQTN